MSVIVKAGTRTYCESAHTCGRRNLLTPEEARKWQAFPVLFASEEEARQEVGAQYGRGPERLPPAGVTFLVA